MLALALSRELTPVVTSIILAGRVGSAFAAELGTMQVRAVVVVVVVVVLAVLWWGWSGSGGVGRGALVCGGGPITGRRCCLLASAPRRPATVPLYRCRTALYCTVPQVSEQTDSLRVLGSDPVDYLITPRVVACMVAGPILNLICFCMGGCGWWGGLGGGDG